MKKVAINGFGRIGRKVLYNYLTDPPEKIEIVAVNDPNPTEELAYLMKYDSVHGRAPFPVEAGPDHIRFGPKDVRVLHERDPTRLPWKDLGVDMVLECTGGHFTERAGAAKHLDAGGASRRHQRTLARRRPYGRARGGQRGYLRPPQSTPSSRTRPARPMRSRRRRRS
ncbi:glyceraldehyde 3-phosphate dehydrogenase N-terminal domain-containing protein [Methanoculleus chikugoensis]|uniref:glyceraldehyde 3-phosphate dehydrogenase NAD-binding domain-containing protein n=1 Tax=Methanoculleus chikugoensis TaxID=118126 RepID=UPI001FB468C4|nr:glyceraldehyde 3-phosphate dehydrogenase NAD-binding domain-containing protein [Methanoculleus chikugoensis]